MSLKPDYKHRYVAEIDAEFDLGNLVDSVLLSTERAQAIISVSMMQFCDGSGKASDAVNAAALDAAWHEIQDIEVIVKAYYGHHQDCDNQPVNFIKRGR